MKIGLCRRSSPRPWSIRRPPSARHSRRCRRCRPHRHRPQSISRPAGSPRSDRPAPAIEQPSAIEIAAFTIGLCALASRRSQSRLTLAIAESRDRLALAWLCSSVADTTEAISATPDASASLAPRSFSTSAMPWAPGSAPRLRRRRAHRRIAERSWPAGTSRPRNAARRRHIRRGPSAASPRSTGNVFTSCRPSRKPTSRRIDTIPRDRFSELGHARLLIPFAGSLSRARRGPPRCRRRAAPPSALRRYWRRSIRSAAPARGTARHRR